MKKGINSKNLEKFIEAKFDHTVITPGTEFMDRLTKALKVNIIYIRFLFMWGKIVILYIKILK